MAYMKDSTGRRLDSFKVADSDAVDETLRAVTGYARAETSGLAAVKAIPNLKWLFTPRSGFFSDTAGTTEQTADAGAVRCWKDASGNNDHATDASTSTLTLTQGVAGGTSGVKVNGAAGRLKTTGTFDSSFDAGYTYFVVAHDPAQTANKVAVASNDGRFYHARNPATNGSMGPVWTASANPPAPRVPVDIPTGVNADPIPGNTMIECVRYNGPGTKTDYWFDGYYALGNANTSATALALTGPLCIGGLSGSFAWGGSILAVAVFNRALSTDEIAIVTDYLSLVTSSQPRALCQLIGNSLTAGTGSSSGATSLPVQGGTSMPGYAAFTGVDYPSRIMHKFPYRDVIVRVDAYPGRRLDQIAAEVGRTTKAMFSPSVHSRRVAVVWELTNSIATNIAANYAAVLAGTTPPAYADLVTVCTALRDQGWIVGVGTCLPRSDLANAADIPKFYRIFQEINALVREHYPEFASFLVDIAADPRFGVPGAELDTTYFNADKVHMNDVGYEAMADLVAAGVAPFLPRVPPRAVITKSVAGGVDVTLKAAEFGTVTGRTGDGLVTFTGALTANINVILPRVTGARATFANTTSGAFTLTVKSSTGTGVAITQGKRVTLQCDGTNWIAVTAEV